ncbi:MAG: hypothetical protein GXO42_02790 [bacterium]|nr:hypothetical protein [bacterium]
MRLCCIALSSHNCFYLQEILEELKKFAAKHKLELMVYKSNVLNERFLPCTWIEGLERIKILGDCRGTYLQVLKFLVLHFDELKATKSEEVIEIYGCILCRLTAKQAIKMIKRYPGSQLRLYNVLDFPHLLLEKQIIATPVTEISCKGKLLRIEGLV